MLRRLMHLAVLHVRVPVKLLLDILPLNEVSLNMKISMEKIPIYIKR